MAAPPRYLFAIPVACLVLTSCTNAPSNTGLPTALVRSAPVPSIDILNREVQRLASMGGGVVGATIVHIESGQRVSIRGDQRFPLASVYKIGIALTLMDQVDQGKLSLSDPVKLKGSDLRPGSGVLIRGAKNPNGWTLGDMLDLMMTHSDNSATDFVLNHVGGPSAVKAYLTRIGVTGISVDRSTLEMIANSVGITELPPMEKFTVAQFYKLLRKVSDEQQREAIEVFERDPRDTGTPDALVDLMVRLHKRELLKPASAQALLDVMYRNRTGNRRLRGFLPPGTAIADKTGTISRSINDMGIFELPDNKGHVAIAVLVKGSDKDMDDRERAIAELARSSYDFFLFQQR